jgi:hypothetical protein
MLYGMFRKWGEIADQCCGPSTIPHNSLGLEGGITYVFAANNNNYEELSNFFVQFNIGNRL